MVSPVATKTWSDGSAVAGTDEESTDHARGPQRVLLDGAGELADRGGRQRGHVRAVHRHRHRPGHLSAGCRPGHRVRLHRDPVGLRGRRLHRLGAPDGSGAVATARCRRRGRDRAALRLHQRRRQPIPTSPDAGSVRHRPVLRDTLRSTGDPYSPTSRDDVVNCASPSGRRPGARGGVRIAGLRHVRGPARAGDDEPGQDVLRRQQRRLRSPTVRRWTARGPWSRGW